MEYPQRQIPSSNVELGNNKNKHLDIKLNQQHIEHLPGESILDSLEREKVDAQFNCREGFCGVCRTKLIQGTVEYTLDPLAFIDDDEILTCCTQPTSHIEIKMEY